MLKNLSLHRIVGDYVSLIRHLVGFFQARNQLLISRLNVLEHCQQAVDSRLKWRGGSFAMIFP